MHKCLIWKLKWLYIKSKIRHITGPACKFDCIIISEAKLKKILLDMLDSSKILNKKLQKISVMTT